MAPAGQGPRLRPGGPARRTDHVGVRHADPLAAHRDLPSGGSLWRTTRIATTGGQSRSCGWMLIRRIQIDPDADRDYHFASVEKVFTPLMLFTACAMAFAHGSNDVANGIGPLAAVVSIVQSGGEVTQKAALPLWILVLGGTGIVVGLATMGYRVMKTIGSEITQLTPVRGYCATLAAAATVVLASRTGLPVSTTHIATSPGLRVSMAWR